MLSVQNLKRLGLGPFALTVTAGERVAMTGPSGAGKSLLLRAIADLDPNSGDVALGDMSRESMPAPRWRAQVMYVPANAGWWAETVRPHFAGCSASQTRDLLHRVNLETSALGWEVARLSTGERQRLALVRAVARKPKILLLDEPTSGLDEGNAERAENLIKDFTDDGGGVLFVTHDGTQAERLGGRTLVLDKGALQETKREAGAAS